MITLIYGDDLEKIEREVVARTEGRRTQMISGGKVGLRELEETVLGNSLFGEDSVFVIDNLFKNAKKKDLLAFINDHQAVDAILIQRTKLQKRDLGLVSARKTLEFFLPQQYFNFLDSVAPGNGRIVQKLYVELLLTMTAEQIYYSLVKRIRALVAVKLSVTSHSEIARMSSWQLGKLSQQARRWDEEDLVSFYGVLFDIECRMKSSQLPSSLAEYIDMMLLTELN